MAGIVPSAVGVVALALGGCGRSTAPAPRPDDLLVSYFPFEISTAVGWDATTIGGAGCRYRLPVTAWHAADRGPARGFNVGDLKAVLRDRTGRNIYVDWQGAARTDKGLRKLDKSAFVTRLVQLEPCRYELPKGFLKPMIEAPNP